MNTLLHLMEAYTNLLQAWPDPDFSASQRSHVEIFLDRIVDAETQHQRLFFGDAGSRASKSTGGSTPRPSSAPARLALAGR